jgi:hypothetical protein
LPIGAPASACPRRHLLTGWPWRLVEASCTLGPSLCTGPFFRHFVGPPAGGPIFDRAGGIRTHGLELMRLARTAAPLPRKVQLAGVEPAISGARSRWGGPLPYSQKTIIQHPGGARTRSFRVENPASSPLRPRGQEAPAAGLEPALSRVTAARLFQLDYAGTIEAEAEGLEPAKRLWRLLRGSNALPFQSAKPPRAGRRGSRTSKTRKPTRFRDGIPFSGSPSPRVAPAGVELAPSRVRAGSSALLSYVALLM